MASGVGLDDRVVVVSQVVLDLHDANPVTRLSLAPGRIHARVLPTGDEHLVSCAQRNPEDHRAQPFARVPVEGDLVGGAVRQWRQLRLHLRDRGVQPRPHVHIGVVTDEAERVDHRLLDQERGRTDCSVVQVEEWALLRVRRPDGSPKRVVGRAPHTHGSSHDGPRSCGRPGQVGHGIRASR
jgi:hypothetical protein